MRKSIPIDIAPLSNHSKVADQFHFDLCREKAWPYSLFCTEHFASLVEKEGWTGLRLKPVWDSDHEPFMHFPTKTEIHTRPDVFGPDGFVKGFEHVWPDEWHRGEIPDVKR